MGRRSKEKASRQEIRQLFEKYLFNIPSYQRYYSWKNKQRKEFFEDLDTCVSDNARNFMSTVVIVGKGEKDKYKYINKEFENSESVVERVDIVDGQQRLTTIAILIKALEEFYKDQHTEDCDKRAEYLNSLLIKKNDKKQQIVIYQSNSNSSELFTKLFFDSDLSEPTTIAEKRMIEAIDDCRNYVKYQDYKDNRTIARNVDAVISIEEALLDRCYVILFMLPEQKDVFQVFESLNSRGLPIAALDNMKSRIMSVSNKMGDTDTSLELDKIWGEIYKIIGSEKIVEDDILTIAASLFKPLDDDNSRPKSLDDAMSYLSQVCDKEILYDNLPERLKASHKGSDTRGVRCRLTSELLREVAKLMVEISKDKTLDALTDVKQARILLIAIKMSKRSSDDKTAMITEWKKTTFRLFCLHRKDARSCIREYMECAEKALDKFTSVNDVINMIKNIGNTYTFEAGIENVRGSKWYPDYNNDVLYIMREYDAYLAKENGLDIDEHLWTEIWSKDASKTIEHIFPATYPKDAKKRKQYEKDWFKDKRKYKNFNQDKLNEFVHNIGNLTLLSQVKNSELQQKPYIEKNKMYERTTLNIHPGTAYLIDSQWTKESIYKREDSILEFIKDKWG